MTLAPSDAETISKETSESRPGSKEYPNGWNFDMKVAESQYKPPIELPAEEIGHGVNRQVYFVSTDLNKDWIELPSVSPHQINVARRNKKFLSGNLDEPVDSFPGSECNYLRALIARISAGSHVSPKNFFRVGSNDEDDDEHIDDDEDDDGVICKLQNSYQSIIKHRSNYFRQRQAYHCQRILQALDSLKTHAVELLGSPQAGDSQARPCHLH